MITKVQYHFLSWITDLKSNNPWSSKPSKSIGMVWFALLSPIPFTHLLMVPTGSTRYALLPRVTTELSFHRKISIFPYDPSIFFVHLLHIYQWTFYQTIFSHGSSSSETLFIQAWEQLAAWEKKSIRCD